MAELNITWDAVHTLKESVVSGGNAESSEADLVTTAAGDSFAWKQPVIIWIEESNPKPGAYDTIGEVIFKNEKVALGMKAFKRLKMTDIEAERDAILCNHGSVAPRFVVMDPNSNTVEVVEKKGRSKLTSSTLFLAMGKIAKKSYTDHFDNTVKASMKVLGDLDKLVDERDTLKGKLDRALEDGAKSEKLALKLDEELKACIAKLDALKTQQAQLWALTPRKPKSL
jgi:hypothetical protein